MAQMKLKFFAQKVFDENTQQSRTSVYFQLGYVRHRMSSGLTLNLVTIISNILFSFQSGDNMVALQMRFRFIRWQGQII